MGNNNNKKKGPYNKKTIDVADIAPGITDIVARAAATQKFVPVSHLRTFTEVDPNEGRREYVYMKLATDKLPVHTPGFVKRLLSHWTLQDKKKYIFSSGNIRKPIVFALLGYFYDLNYENDIPLLLNGKYIEEMTMLMTSRPLPVIPMYLPETVNHIFPKQGPPFPSIQDLDLIVACTTPLPECCPSSSEEEHKENHPGHPHNPDHDSHPVDHDHPDDHPSHDGGPMIVYDYLIQIRTEDDAWTVFDPFAVTPDSVFIPMEHFESILAEHDHVMVEGDARRLLLHYCSHPEGKAAMDLYVKMIRDPLRCLAVNPPRKYAKIVRRMLPDTHGWLDD